MRGINAAVLGRGWRLLEQGEEIREGDETGCASLLVSVRYFEDWRPVEAWAVGMTVAGALVDDGDAAERLFRRRSDTSPDATWNAALEAAALKADEEANGWEAGFHRWRDTDIDAADRCSGRETVARNVAGAIRALKRGQSSTSAKPPCDSCHERPRGAGLSVCESCAKAIYGRRVSP